MSKKDICKITLLDNGDVKVEINEGVLVTELRRDPNFDPVGYISDRTWRAIERSAKRQAKERSGMDGVKDIDLRRFDLEAIFGYEVGEKIFKQEKGWNK